MCKNYIILTIFVNIYIKHSFCPKAKSSVLHLRYQANYIYYKNLYWTQYIYSTFLVSCNTYLCEQYFLSAVQKLIEKERVNLYSKKFSTQQRKKGNVCFEGVSGKSVCCNQIEKSLTLINCALLNTTKRFLHNNLRFCTIG